MPKKVLIALPPAMLEQVDWVAKQEHRTRSDLIREAIRRYINEYRIQNTLLAERMGQKPKEKPTSLE
jgi:metal-responsive CopG/Arc/MetJ family transcriptional regulator